MPLKLAAALLGTDRASLLPDTPGTAVSGVARPGERHGCGRGCPLRKLIEQLTAKKRMYVDAVVEKRISPHDYELATEGIQRELDDARIAEAHAREREADVADRASSPTSARFGAKGQRALQTTVFHRRGFRRGGVFGTPKIASIFLHLRAVEGAEDQKASPGGFEPPLAP